MYRLILFFSFFLFQTLIFSETIKFWHSWSNEEASILSSVIAKYEAVSGNKVIVQGIPFNSFQNRFINMASRGDAADVIIGPADWLGLFAEKDLLLPFSAVAQESDKNGFIKEALDSCYFNGKLYGYPESVRIIVLYYNKKLVPNPPETTKDMISIGTSITDEANGIYGLVYDKTNFYYHIPWLTGFGGKVLNENNRPTFTSKENISSLKFLRNLTVGSKKMIPEENTNFEMTMMMFNQGMAGMMINGNWILGDLKKNSRINIGIARLPIISETGLPVKPLAGSEVVMISANSKYKSAAYDFVQFLTSSEIQAEFVKSGHIPSRDDVYEMRRIKTSNFYNDLLTFRSQISNSVPMPTAPEMNYGVWDLGNEMLYELFNTNNGYDAITREAQNKAVRRIIQSKNK